MIAASPLVQPTAAFRTWLRHLFDLLLRQVFFLCLLLGSVDPLVILSAAFVFVHGNLAAEAVAILAVAAGEDVAIGHGRA